jgi:Zn-dependent protease
MFVSNGRMSFETIVFGLPAVLISMSFHEFAHAFVADRMGDPTPRMQGRLTIDIRKHIDIWGLLSLLLIGFGWGKPVETNSRYLKNTKRDMAIIASAGPIMNALLAIITTVIMIKIGLMNQINANKLSILLLYIALYNAGFAVFNLLPVPGFDGSRIVGAFLTNKAYYSYIEFEYKYQMEITIVLLILLSTNILNAPLMFLRNGIINLGFIISNLLPF